MKKRRKILLKRLLFTVKLGILCLGLSVLLSMPAVTMPAHAFGHSNNYNGMAYLAETEVRTTEIRTKTDDKRITARVKVDAKDRKELSQDFEETVPLKKK